MPDFGRVHEWPTATVPIASLIPSDSPRVAGENSQHVHMLAELEVKTPIVVHRQTMRVVDGMHRVRAAAERGRDTIEVRFFDGDVREIFILAVMLNASHGLPLSLADRTTAASRVMRSHPNWSDQMIAELTSLSGKTIAAIRARSTSDIPKLNKRMGRDGKARPLNVTHGRRLAGTLMRERPGASLREIAREAGISLGTAQDVRRRLRSGLDPVPRGPETADVAIRTPGVLPRPRSGDEPLAQADVLRMLSRLKDDPSLRFSETGRRLLRLLDVLSISSDTWAQVATGIPAYWADAVESLSRACADAWSQFADRVAQQAITEEQTSAP
jgi:ParB-like chromosome segregation protein Spo0J